MAGESKRLDLKFGSFACSVQGFDDPVAPVQQMLHAMQHVLEESPELGTAGISFDAEMIEQLIEEVGRRADLDDSNIEIVPGLIIIHHGGSSRRDPVADEADDGVGDAPEQTDYVNIFAPGGRGPDLATDDDPFEDVEEAHLELTAAGSEDNSEDRHSDLIAARLGSLHEQNVGDVDEDALPRDIFAESDEEPTSRGSVSVETRGASASGPSGISFFTSPLESVRRARDERDGGHDGERDGGHADDDENTVSLRLFSAADAKAAEIEPANSGTPQPEPAATSLFSGPSQGASQEVSHGPSREPSQPEEAADGYTAASLAAKAKATAVADLIVSAAAWMVLIKGQTSFSRKDVLAVFDEIPGEHDKSIQSRIKGFGKAVRNDQLVQIEEGLFGLSRSELKRFEKAL